MKQYFMIPDIFQQQNISPHIQLEMSSSCFNCQLTRHKIQELMAQYEQLLRTKQQQLRCSHQIISQLEHELKLGKKVIASNGTFVKQFQKNTNKIMSQQQEAIQYLKSRQVKLVEQLKNTENQIFKLVVHVEDNLDITNQKSQLFKQKSNEKNQERNKQRQRASCRSNSKQYSSQKDFITPRKNILICNSGNVTLNKDKQNNTFERIFQQSTIGLAVQSTKDKLLLKVAEDKLQLMNIKYKMALLKTVQVATLR